MKVESYKITGWKKSDVGILIAENNEWILVKHITSDYIIDGYKIYNKEFVDQRINSEFEKELERKIKFKERILNKPNDFKFTDTIRLLKWIEKKYGLFAFQDEDEHEIVYGKINRLTKYGIVLDVIKVNGSVDCNYEFDIDEIRVITLETDYHISIGLLSRNNLKVK
jgi:hypothetical protein